MLVSIPVDGAHYFTDMFVGIAIAAASFAAARSLVARGAALQRTISSGSALKTMAP